MKKCVVIGSGLGGLSTAYILARNDYDVTVLEQGSQIGGCLQCFNRGGVTFDTGMHYIGSADPGQTLDTLFHFLNVKDNVRLSRLDPEGYDVISLKGEHYKFANGKENFIETLAQHFPKSKDELSEYYDTIKHVAKASMMHSLNRNIDINVNARYQICSVNQVIDSIISDHLLREVLTGSLQLYAGEKDYTPFSTHALIMDFYDMSAFRLIGGSGSLAKSLADNIKNTGGKVLTRRKATNIECDATHATAVITENGERFPADLVISAIHPTCTMDLVKSHIIRPAYRNRMQSLRNTVGAFTIYLKFRENSVPYINHNLYYHRSDSVWGGENYDETSWPKNLIYMHLCHEDNPRFAKAGDILTYMNFKEVEKWKGTKIGCRGNDYEEFKRQKAEIAINALEKEVPNLRGNIDSYYTSTPLTYYDYTGIPEGSLYGVAKNADMLGRGTISCKTRIPNLLLTGQNITSHGMLGVLASSLITCSEILSTDTVFSQIKHSY